MSWVETELGEQPAALERFLAAETAHATEIARGLVNYSASESARILGKPSSEIQAILGYVDEPELIHRDNLPSQRVLEAAGFRLAGRQWDHDEQVEELIYELSFDDA